ncbi:hypothetical protein, partial [Geodermatophilus maliterrae]
MWALGGLVAWLVLGLLLGTVVGRAVRLADRRTAGTGSDHLTTGDLPWASTRPVSATQVRRRVPIPPVAVALAVTGVALETVGYAVRLADVPGRAGRLLSMDAPFSVPRFYIAALLAAAAVAAAVGGAGLGERRTWWTAVALVTGCAAAIKTGSTVHADALSWASDSFTPVGAVLLSVVVVGAVVGGLWSLSRGDRRDRRRVLGCLSLYAAASVGLSAVSGTVGSALGGGSRWAAMATLVEECGEAVGAVALLVAVLVGVAPRLVLPAGWALRRTDDAHTLDLLEMVPGSTAGRPTV